MKDEGKGFDCDAHYQLMVDNLMRCVREWTAERGGMTGELHLKKTHVDGAWTIELVQVHPVSTWRLGP